jgi:hypothetical protein
MAPTSISNGAENSILSNKEGKKRAVTFVHDSVRMIIAATRGAENGAHSIRRREAPSLELVWSSIRCMLHWVSVNSRVIASTSILSTQASKVRVMWQSFLRTCFVCLADTMYFL